MSRTYLALVRFPFEREAEVVVSAPIPGPIGSKISINVSAWSSLYTSTNCVDLKLSGSIDTTGVTGEVKFIVLTSENTCLGMRHVNFFYSCSVYDTLSRVPRAYFGKSGDCLTVLAYFTITEFSSHSSWMPSSSAASLPKLEGVKSSGGSFQDYGVVGLKNQGATCYLNSLLQALFHLPLLRRLVFEAPVDLEARPIRSEQLNLVEEVEEDNGIIVVDDSDQEEGKAGSSSSSSSSSAAALVENPASDASLSGLTSGALQVCKRSKVISSLQELFFELQCGPSGGGGGGSSPSEEAASTKPLTSAFGWDGEEVWRQQDAMELFTKLVERLVKELGGDFSPLGGALSTLFHFSTQTSLSVAAKSIFKLNPPDTQSSLTLYMDAQGGRGSSDILTLFRNRFSTPKTIEDWEVEGGEKVTAVEREHLHALPPVLCISINRFTYDKDLGARTKLCGPVHFPETLDLSEFLPLEQSQPGGRGGAQQQGGGGPTRSPHSSEGLGSTAASTKQQPLPLPPCALLQRS